MKNPLDDLRDNEDLAAILATLDPDEREMGDPIWSPRTQKLIRSCQEYIAYCESLDQ